MISVFHGVYSTFLTAPLAASPLLSALDGLSFPTILIGVVAVQVYRYRRVSTPAQRQQTKWAVFGIALAMVGFVIVIVLNALFPASYMPGTLYYLGVSTLLYVALLCVPLFIGLAILRAHLWDIDLVINRTLVYGTLTTSIVGLYVLVVGYLEALFRSSGNLVISLVATGLVAVLFQPLRQLLQRGANRLLYGQRDEPYTVVTRLSQRLEATLAPDAVLSTIVETVAQALKLPYAAILLTREDTFILAASYGQPGPDLLRLPLVYQAETVGQLCLASRTPGEPFSGADRQLFAELARHAGLAAHAVRLTVDLQRSRAHLVTTREEERRRLRRDLHDGLGSTLTGVVFKLDATETLLDQDPLRARAVLAEARAQTQATINDIRRLVYNLRPPILDEWGLLAALREQVAQYELNNVQVAFVAPESLPPLSAAVEVAAYRIVLEALTNVIKHAQATACTIRLGLLAEALTIEVEDNGVGRAHGAAAGVGLTTMGERASELGGSCSLEEAAPHGTRVLARLPLAKE
jgi:signal transduction histidine kinase